MSTTWRAIAIGGAVGLIALIVLLTALRPSGIEPTAPPPPTTATPAAASAGPVGSGGPETGSPATGAPTAAASEAPVAVLVGAGDIADCASPGDEATADVLEDIPGTVFTLGDNAYEDGTPREFRECYGPSWGRPSILERTRPVPGNHEYKTKDAQGYFGYFGAAAGDPDEGWYAFDLGAWRGYALNTNCTFVGGCEAGSPQERWLRADLEANPRECVVALWHNARFSSGVEHGSDPISIDLWRALQDAGADLALVGHEHSYERFSPQTASGEADADRGIVQIVVGTGGRRLYEFAEIQPNSLVRGSEWGVLKVTLLDGGYDFEFVPVAGGSFADAGSGTCH